MKEAVEEINEKHLEPWGAMCKNQIENTILTPYMDVELLLQKHLNLDNSKLKATGYTLRHPQITRQLVEEVCRTAIENLIKSL